MAAWLAGWQATQFWQVDRGRHRSGSYLMDPADRSSSTGLPLWGHGRGWKWDAAQPHNDMSSSGSVMARYEYENANYMLGQHETSASIIVFSGQYRYSKIQLQVDISHTSIFSHLLHPPFSALYSVCVGVFHFSTFLSLYAAGVCGCHPDGMCWFALICPRGAYWADAEFPSKRGFQCVG